MKFPREESESREGQDVVSLRPIRDDLADEEEHMEESILTANSGMRRVLRQMGFRITEPGEEEGQGTNEQRDQPMEELPTPSEETHDPERESRIKPRKAMLFDGPEQPSGSETAEERRSRLVRESLIAHARMQVFKTHYNRNKKTYLEMRRELGDDVDGKGLFKFEALDEQGNAHPVEVDEECDYSPTSVGDGPEGAEGVEIQSPMNPIPLSEPEGSRKGIVRSQKWKKVVREVKKIEHQRRTSRRCDTLGHHGQCSQRRRKAKEPQRNQRFRGRRNLWKMKQNLRKMKRKMNGRGSPGLIRRTTSFWRMLKREGRSWMKKICGLTRRKLGRSCRLGDRRGSVSCGKQEAKAPKFPEEPKGPFEPDGGPNPGGPASGSGSGGTIAVRAFRVLTDPEWQFVDPDSPEGGQGRRTEGGFPGHLEGEGLHGLPEGEEGPGHREGELPVLPEEGLPSDSEERPTPLFGSSVSNLTV